MASPDYLLRHGHPAHPRDLEAPGHKTLEFRNPETGKPYPWEFHQKRKRIVLTTRGRLLVNDPGALMHACLGGLGVAQMLLLGAEQWIAENRLVTLFPDWRDERFPLYAYYPSRSHVPARTRAMLDFVMAELGGKV